MKECRKNLKEIIENIILPDIEDHIDEIFETIANDKVADDALKTELENMQEMRTEFNSILEEISNDELSDEECQEIYDDIIDMISE